jgi:hypothetical protein
MTEMSQQYLDAVSKSQQAVLNALQAWTEQVQSGFEAAVGKGLRPGVPSPVELVDSTFDNIEKVVKIQHDFLHAVAEAFGPAVQRTLADVQAATERFARQGTTEQPDKARRSRLEDAQPQ